MVPVVVNVLVVVSAIIHLLPLSGVLGAKRLRALYGVPIDDATTLLAMRHRATMFGVLGAGLIAGLIWAPALLPAMAMTAASDVAFLVLALVSPGTHPAMRKVVVADVVSIVCLLGAWGVPLALG